MSYYIVITDLDGCLLDPITYSYEGALETIRELRKAGIPIIFCSTKTRVEQEYFRSRLGIVDPFIVENGAAIYIPRDYFIDLERDPVGTADSYYVIEYGIRVRELIGRIRDLIIGYKRYLRFIDRMSIEEIMALTGLPRDQAGLVRIREYSLVFHPIDRVKATEFIERVRARRLRVVSGAGILYTITGDHDKGVATRKIIELYRRVYGEVISIGIGDSPIDVPMLKAVDIPVILGDRIDPVKHGLINNENLIIVDRRGPIGWSKALETIFKA